MSGGWWFCPSCGLAAGRPVLLQRGPIEKVETVAGPTRGSGAGEAPTQLDDVHIIQWAALPAAQRSRLEGLSDSCKDPLRVRIVDADYFDAAGSDWAPAGEHARAGEAGENADEWGAAGGGYMLAGGVVANV